MKKILLLSLIFISCKAAQTNEEQPGAAQAAQARQNIDNDEKAAKERLEREYNSKIHNAKDQVHRSALCYSFSDMSKDQKALFAITEYFLAGNKALKTYELDRLELMNNGKGKK